ncbi:hypothetical protein ABZ747_31945 [Kitasatospora cineracea]|uniref:hypothetical protein n=1 Tax=Kitasatospora cineracea TaxID=88074 RepID=UPI0033F97560
MAEAALWWAVLCGLYTVLISTVDALELLVGALAALLGAAAAGPARRASGARVFGGRGRHPAEHPGEPETTGEGEEPEVRGPQRSLPRPMVAVPALLLAGCLAVGLVPAVGRPIAAAAARFTDRSGYLGAVLDGAAAPPLPAPPADWTGSGILLGLLSTALHRPLPAPAWARHAVRALRRLHSGLLGDYVTWLLVGLAGLLAAVAALS